ncbi:MAG: Unknown protein [uncultured Sulfurovum sp.]|uniref:CHAT domain-containing protein n=1 Tax=uncultured Sulfurovum sp. TaxID=269237 RepID=A0A6S6T1A1_9BACT|nr:MAG: Unknown protein [uncultured Sulfurovum sp.]
MILWKGLANMLRLLGRGIFISVFFSFFLFGIEDFEKICEEEIAKEELKISLINQACVLTAKKYEKERDMGNASWYYLISNNAHQYLNEQEGENTSFNFYTNLGHAYILKHDFKNAKIAYENVLTFNIDLNQTIHEDYALLFKRFPNKEKSLVKGLQLWNKTNFTFLNILELSTKYEKLYNEKKYDSMIEQLQKIIKIKNQTILKDSASIMMDYYNLAKVYEERKQYKNAIINYQASLNLAKKMLDKDHIHIGTTHNDLGLVFNELKEYEQAEEAYFLALKIYQKHFTKEDNEIAIIYNNLATIYGDRQQYEQALNYYQKALKIEEKNAYENIVHTYYNIGLLYQQMKEYGNVLSYYKKILPWIEKNTLDMATYYTLVGAYYQEIEENNQALWHYQEALKIREKALGEIHSDTAETYNSLGSIYEQLKDFEQALTFYQKALKINQHLLDKNDIFIAISHNNIASIYTNLEEYNKSKISLLQALEIKKNILKKDDIDFAVTYNNLGFIEEKLRNYAEALSYYNHALSIYTEVKGKQSLEVAILYNHIASLYKEKKAYELSIEYLEKAKNIINTLLKDDHTQRALIYNNLGLLYTYTQNYKKAYAFNILSFDIFLKNRNKNFKILNHKQKGLYLESFGNRIDNLCYAAHLYKANLKHTPKKTHISLNTLNTWLKYKGTLFEYDNILSMVKNNPNTSQETQKLISNLNDFNIQLSNLKKKNNETKIKEIETQIHNIQIEFSKKNDSFKNLLKLQNINSSQIVKVLKPHQLYIDFARGDEHYYLFTLNHKNQITFQQIEHNQTLTIDTNIQDYRNNTANMAKSIDNKTVEKNQSNSLEEAKKILSNLHYLIIQNHLTEQIKDKNHLILSPDGLLNYLPFEALYHNNEYLIQSHKINYISSGKEFVRQTKIIHQKPQKEIIIFANANFDATLKSYEIPNKDSLLAPMFGNPNKVKRERVFSSLGKGEIDILKKYYKDPLIFKEKNATIKNLMQLPSSKILHLSTHGLFLEDKNILNPMQKSLLIFAGGNTNFKQATVSALDLSTLDLKDTELVVLSACQSGLGEIQTAEGIVGLPKALLQAGAKNVIMSLWTVSNKKTAMLMDYFYANIAQQQNYSTALQNAKINMINMHPYYWSSFILSGL